jgi:hypothetical protein
MNYGKESPCLTPPPSLIQRLKLRLPKFLVLRRRYEVDESMWLVKFGRSKGKVFVKWGIATVRLGNSAKKKATEGGHKFVLVLQWGRMPKEWELSFVSKMKSAEARGISFHEVLRTDLPSVIGEGPSDVLLRWIGKEGRNQPKRFVKAVVDTFGPSGQRIITSLESLLDPEKFVDAHKSIEDDLQSLIEAIRVADEAKLEPASLEPN